MCKAWDDHKQSGIKEGRIVGEREGRIAGQQEGRIAERLESICDLLSSYPDSITEELTHQLTAITDPAGLKQAFLLALSCKTCGEFAQKLRTIPT